MESYDEKLDNSDLKKQIYITFANMVNKKNIKWVVLHGAEGYPNNIGRDLDVLCKNKNDTLTVLKSFESCLKNQNIKWIMYQNPIWGYRITGISKEYDYFELHIIDSLRVGNICFEVKWEKISYVNNIFPIDEYTNFCKKFILPFLTGRKIKFENPDVKKHLIFSEWPFEFIAELNNLDEFRNLDKFNFFANYFISHPISSIYNSFCWLNRKIARYYNPSCPIFLISHNNDYLRLSLSLKNKLLKIFPRIVCGDNCNLLQILVYQSTQSLVYITTPKKFLIEYSYPIPPDLSETDFLDYIIDKFHNFNSKWYIK